MELLAIRLKIANCCASYRINGSHTLRDGLIQFIFRPPLSKRNT